MKKVLTMVLAAVLLVVSAVAQPVSTDSDIIPGVVAMENTDEVYVEYCVVYVDAEDNEAPAPGLDVVLNDVCRDTNNVPGCQLADAADPAEFMVTVEDSVTGADGCATLRLNTYDAMGGVFYYEVNGEVEGEAVTEETGAAYIPEFTAIGAGLALLGAGVYMANRRKE
jgi:hypothetical protein